MNSLLYLSPGNLPSKVTHSIQIAKMSQAFARDFKDFELVTRGDILSFFRGCDRQFKEWYGLETRLKIIRLPLQWKVTYPLPNDYYAPRGYYKIALLYTCLKAPDIVYTRSPDFVKFVLNMNLPIFWEWHELIEERSPYLKLLKNDNLAGLIVTLPQIAESAIALGVPPEKIFVAPNATDMTNLLPYQSKSLARQSLSLSSAQPIILYSGHLYEYKGIPTILEVAKLLPQYHFILVGGWEQEVKQVRSQCLEKDLKNVKIIGHVPQSQLALYLYTADIVLLPTSQTWELAGSTCPLKMFDYMTVKRPIVASDLPTIQTVLRDGENALLAQSDCPVAFREAIVRLIENPALGDRLAERAFQDVQTLTWDNRARQILQFLSERSAAREPNWNSRSKNLRQYVKLLRSHESSIM
ncbi:MAG: glycosyltransferase [Spirulina sp.]